MALGGSRRPTRAASPRVARSATSSATSRRKPPPAPPCRIPHRQLPQQAGSASFGRGARGARQLDLLEGSAAVVLRAGYVCGVCV